MIVRSFPAKSRLVPSLAACCRSFWNVVGVKLKESVRYCRYSRRSSSIFRPFQSPILGRIGQVQWGGLSMRRWVRSRRSRLIWVDLLLAPKLDQVRGWRSPWGVTERKIEEELLQSIPVDVEDGRNE